MKPTKTKTKKCWKDFLIKEIKMKKIKYTFLIGTFSILGIKAQNSLTVNIENIPSAKGNVEIGLFNSEKGFLKEGSQFIKKKVKVIGNSLKYTFQNLPKGNYAVAVFHDENLNNKCDTNFIGMPTEGFGFSNNFRPKLSAPKFNQTKVFVENNKNIHINLIN